MILRSHSLSHYSATLLPVLVGFVITIVDSANLCQNLWRFPQDCQMPNCTYQIVWRYKQPEDSIEFIVSSSHPSRWTGIIFSNDANVSQSDAIFAWVEDDTYVMMDAFMPDFSHAISDKQQSVSNISANLFNGIATFKFTRKRDTHDDQDISFADDNKCPYLVFPVDGGSVNYKTRKIVTDEYHPYISDRRVCIRPCDPPPPASTTPSQTTTSRPQVPFPTPSRTTKKPQASTTSTSTTTTQKPKPQTTATTTTTSTSTTTSTPTPTTTSSSTSTTTTTTTTPRPTTTTTPRPTSKRPTTTSSSSSTTTTLTTTTTTSTTTTTTPAPTTQRVAAKATPTTTTTTTIAPPPQTSPIMTTSQTVSSVAAPARAKSNTDNEASQSSFVPVSNKAESVATSASTASSKSSGSTAATISQSNDQQWCAGRWSYPPNCRFRASAPAEVFQYLQAPIDAAFNIKPLPIELSDCAYFAQWQYLEQPSDSIEFIIQTKTRNRWTGIGFSNSTRMANSDAIIGIIEEHGGRHFIMDTWLRDHVMPDIDQQQDIRQTYGKRENGTTTVKFRRSRLTGDQFDFQFTDNSCAYFFFPTQGGSFNAISKRLNKHDSIPSVSEHKICIKSCSTGKVSSGNNELLKQQVGENNVINVTSSSSASDTTSQSSPSNELSADGAPTLSTGSSSSPKSSQQQQQQQPRSNATNQSSNQAPNAIHQDDSSTPSSSQVNGSEKSIDSATNPNNLAPSNDLNEELDGVGTSSSTTGQVAPTTPHPNLFSRLAIFSEPSLRWLAGIGCVATMLAMIVFQACFTMYKNKQAYKQNLYSRPLPAFKPKKYKHNSFLAHESGSMARNYNSSGGANTNTNSNSDTVIASNGMTAHAHHNQPLMADSGSNTGTGTPSGGGGALLKAPVAGGNRRTLAVASGYQQHGHGPVGHHGHRGPAQSMRYQQALSVPYNHKGDLDDKLRAEDEDDIDEEDLMDEAELEDEDIEEELFDDMMDDYDDDMMPDDEFDFGDPQLAGRAPIMHAAHHGHHHMPPATAGGLRSHQHQQHYRQGHVHSHSHAHGHNHSQRHYQTPTATSAHYQSARKLIPSHHQHHPQHHPQHPHHHQHQHPHPHHHHHHQHHAGHAHVHHPSQGVPAGHGQMPATSLRNPAAYARTSGAPVHSHHRSAAGGGGGGNGSASSSVYILNQNRFAPYASDRNAYNANRRSPTGDR